jgi:hypothetical protein
MSERELGVQAQELNVVRQIGTPHSVRDRYIQRNPDQRAWPVQIRDALCNPTTSDGRIALILMILARPQYKAEYRPASRRN